MIGRPAAPLPRDRWAQGRRIVEALTFAIADIQKQTKQQALAKIAILPAIMCVCYLGLIAYYKSRGGYQAEVLTGHAADDEKFTGGVPGPVEA